MNSSIEFQVHGRYALFTDILVHSGGEKFTYPIPTYQALKGIVESIYWKPTFTWVIDEVRIMNQISTYSKGVKTNKYDGGHGLSIYTYLTDALYQLILPMDKSRGF